MKYSELTNRKKREMEDEVSERFNISSRGSRRLLEEDEQEFHGANRQRITREDYEELDKHRKRHKNYYR